VRDERIARYADLLVGTCIDVQPGWEVIVAGSPPGKPLLQEIGKAIGRRGARAIFQVTFSSTFAASDFEWVKEAPRELLDKPSLLQVHCSRTATRSSWSNRRRTPGKPSPSTRTA
jgi:leucyl aminopeptidase (aminopeptidase T)